MRSKHLFRAFIFSIVLLTNASAQSDLNKAQAVFVYNFLSHIKWPDNVANDKYTIGFYGETPTFEQLKSYTASRKVGNKSIEVKALSSIEEAKNCHVLFVAKNKTDELGSITSAIASKSCLIIGEQSGAINKGATVDFRLVNGKLGYKLSQEQASKHNLFVSRALQTMSL